jgi:hypothetical protein
VNSSLLIRQGGLFAAMPKGRYQSPTVFEAIFHEPYSTIRSIYFHQRLYLLSIRAGRGQAEGGVFERTMSMNQQHKFRAVINDREDFRDMSYRALERRITIPARVFRTNLHDSGSQALDRNDMTQRVAQTLHLGKTIDDIPDRHSLRRVEQTAAM